ncbi:MAG: hypothetical protein ABGW74_05780 [Campylobacterales bacterium]
MQQHYNIKLHDIKPIIEVEEYSFYYLIGFSILTVLLISGLVYLFIKWYKNRKKYNQREEYSKILKSLDLKDAKKSAYAITFYGALFKDDSPRHTEMFKNLTERLEAYKYKKNVQEFDKETLGYIELYKGMLDV